MPHSTVSSINDSVQKTQVWLKELAEEGNLENEDQAYTALRAVLHALRDRLRVDQAVHLASQMPLVIKGVYYDGWKPSQVPKDQDTPDEFREQVRSNLAPGGNVDADHATRSVLSLLNRQIPGGELGQVRESLPQELRQIWPTD